MNLIKGFLINFLGVSLLFSSMLEAQLVKEDFDTVNIALVVAKKHVAFWEGLSGKQTTTRFEKKSFLKKHTEKVERTLLLKLQQLSKKATGRQKQDITYVCSCIKGFGQNKKASIVVDKNKIHRIIKDLASSNRQIGLEDLYNYWEWLTSLYQAVVKQVCAFTDIMISGSYNAVIDVDALCNQIPDSQLKVAVQEIFAEGDFQKIKDILEQVSILSAQTQNKDLSYLITTLKNIFVVLELFYSLTSHILFDHLELLDIKPTADNMQIPLVLQATQKILDNVQHYNSNSGLLLIQLVNDLGLFSKNFSHVISLCYGVVDSFSNKSFDLPTQGFQQEVLWKTNVKKHWFSLPVGLGIFTTRMMESYPISNVPSNSPAF